MIISEKITSKIKILDELKNTDGFRQNVGSNSLISLKKLDEDTVALKKIKTEAKISKEKRAQIFFREVTDHILADHPCVLPLCGYNNFHFSKKLGCFIYRPRLATKFCDEGMLSSVLKKMRRNKQLTKNYIQTQQFIFAYGIAKGMENLYKKHILHRDLKNDNIFISKPTFGNENIPKDILPLFNSDVGYSIPFIADLGLAKVAVDSEQSQQCGTYYYLAPEVMSTVKYTFPVDVYSYAVILSNIFQLKEKPEFKCKLTTLNFVQHISNGGRPLIKGCTDNQKDYLSGLWNSNPDERPTFTDIVEYLENPGNKFIFTDYDPDVINAYKKYIEYQLNSNPDSISKSQSNTIDNIFKKYQKYERDQEEFYRLDQEDNQALSKTSNGTNKFKSSITSSIIQNSSLSSDQDEIQINEYISSYINLSLQQNPNPMLSTSKLYLREGILSEAKGDYENAKKYYLNSLKNGSIQAATKLSILLLREGDSESKKNGYDLLKFASDKKDKDALFYFGYLLNEGFEPSDVKADKEKAALLLEESGKLGNKRGFFEAASIHHELAIKLSTKGKNKLAIKQLSKAVELYNTSYEKYGDKESQKFSNELQSFLKKQE